MKTLYLFRHAKSDWSNPSLDDFDRPLASRGIKAGTLMGRVLHDRGKEPGLVLCSAAKRALETWNLLQSQMGGQIPVKVMRSLYLAPPSKILSTLQRVQESVPSVMVIGHNPGFEHLAFVLSGPSSKPKALRKLREKYPTAALAEIEFDAKSWSTVGNGPGRLVQFMTPKDIS